MATRAQYNGNPCVNCLQVFGNAPSFGSLRALCLFDEQPDEEDRVFKGSEELFHMECVKCKGRSQECWQLPDKVKADIDDFNTERTRIMALPDGAPRNKAVVDLGTQATKIYGRVKKHFPSFRGMGHLHGHLGGKDFDQTGPHYDANEAKRLAMENLPAGSPKKAKNVTNWVPSEEFEKVGDTTAELVAVKKRLGVYARALKAMHDTLEDQRGKKTNLQTTLETLELARPEQDDLLL